MPKELDLFLKDNLSFKEKFYKLMNILISNQPDSPFETLFFMILNYLQILSSFYSEQIKVFNPKNSKSDLFLYNIEKIIRVKDIFRNNYRGLERLEYVLLIILFIGIIYFLIVCSKININSIYSYNKNCINYLIKIFLYLTYNIILDISFSNFCFGFSENNPNFDEEVKCIGTDKILIIVISVFFILISFSIKCIFQIYYTEPFYLSHSYYSKMLSDYDLLMDLNYLLLSIFLTQSYFLSKELFLIYNLIISISLCIYYIKHYLYYDPYINLLAGIFHLIYAWTSIFSIFFAYINFNEKGIIYLISCIIVGMSYFNIKNKIENDIFYNIPLTKFKNINYLLYFLKVFTERVIKYEEKNENKAFIAGVLQIILDECPNERCAQLLKGEIYLPLENKWGDNKKRNVDDIVFLKYFVVILFNYLLHYQYSYPEIYFNLSMYYLKVMGNYCEAMYYCQKIDELKLNRKQKYTFIRLRLKITESLIEKFKPSNEQNASLENINISMYYKYDDLCHNFIEEISNDIDLSFEFWRIFKRSLKDANFKIDFNKVFKLTEKIQITKKNIEKMWKDLMNIYNGINEYFQFYNDYVDQINNDDLKKRDLDSIKKKEVNFTEHLNHNYYSILFSNDTGIMIVNGDKGSEGIIKQCNKKIELIFNYNSYELKDFNVNKLMPKLYDKKHSKYIERYFRVGYKKYMETKDFKTFGKEKNNSIIQIKIALKLLPILNYNVFLVSLIIKENINDIILIDENFNIQGMSSKLLKILNIDNNLLFQEINIPFYLICKKFINFYSIFLRKKETVHTLIKKKSIISEKDKNDNLKLFEEEDKEAFINKGGEETDREKIHENLEINENVELEFEIKLPQFLINYSNTKTNNKPLTHMEKTLSMISENIEKNNYSESESISEDNEEDYENDIINNDNENELLVPDSNNINKTLDAFYTKNFGPISPTPGEESSNPTPTPCPTSPTWNKYKKKKSFKNNFNRIDKKSEEEKICLEKIEEYKHLFNEEKFEELEDLIDLCNKDSVYSEYKFNFTFDRYKFGDNDMAYIIRCIDNQNQEGLSEEKSVDFDSKAVKYKKEKAEAIKPLFELLDDERKEILHLPDIFLKLSSENSKFQELLEQCKNEIINVSKIQGQKKDEVLEDENSSQTSQTGFDNGLVKKNKIQEIRSNLFNNISNFYTLKYIKFIIIMISIFTIIFSIVYLIFTINCNSNMKNVSFMNLCLFQTTLWTSELINIFISLKTLYLKKLGKNDYDFLNFQSEEIKTNEDYYIYMEKLANDLYYNLSISYGQLEMNIPLYLSDWQLLSLYWDKINVSYINNDYIRNNKISDESFPTSAVQFLSNAINFLKKFNISNIQDLIDDQLKEKEKLEYLNYITYLIIENGYNNIIPDLLIKVQKIPNIFSEYNTKNKKTIYIIISIYIGLMLFICIFYFIMIRLTNSSMTEILEKMTKIKLEKIDETIRKIENFRGNLKKFRDKDIAIIDEQEQNEIIKEDLSPKKSPSIISRYKSNYSLNNILDKNDTDEASSFIESNGFSSDIKKYYPLTILREYLSHCIIFLFLLFGFIFPIYFNSINTIKDINQFLLIENYIYGRLISASVDTLELKCFINNCSNTTVLNFAFLQNTDNIQEVISGIKKFKEIENFYNNKFLLNACEAAINKNNDKKKYDICLNESIINSANNTDNIMKLLEYKIDNIFRKNEMNKGKIETLRNGTNVTYFRQMLFNITDFKEVEDIFYKYIFTVDNIFEEIIKRSLDDYLKIKKYLLIILVFCLALLMVLYNFIFLAISVPKLVYLLNVSRCVLKIIPTSVIMTSPELEAWIENKY